MPNNIIKLPYLPLLFTVYLLAPSIMVCSQPANKPTTLTQVPAAGATGLRTAPAAYTIPAGGLKVNYVRTREAKVPVTDAVVFAAKGYTEVTEVTQYVDGLGRPLQTVAKQASPTAIDIVQPVDYDAFGREIFKYLPYPEGSDGKLKTNPFGSQATYYGTTYKTEQPAYTGEQVYFSRTEVEPSPLNRVLKQFAQGNSWAGSYGGTTERAVKMEYLVNDVNDAVRSWNIVTTVITYNPATDDANNIPISTLTYDPGTLYENVTIDEHGSKVIEYKDKEGKVILKKVQDAASPSVAHTGWLCTYYVYDDLGLLRFVIPPKAVALMNTNNVWTLNTYTNLVNGLCFRYLYDERQRMVAKKVPDAGWVYMLYDNRNRLVYTQDANLRASSKWLATFYDGLNRPLMTAMINSATASQLKTQLDAQTSFAATSVAATANSVQELYVDKRITTTGLYTAPASVFLTDGFDSEVGAEFEVRNDPAANSSENVAITGNPVPAGITFIALTLTYYDNYSWKSDNEKSFTTVYATKLSAGSNIGPETYPTTIHGQLTGLVTGTKVRTLPDPTNLAGGRWLTTVSYYDDDYRVVQAQADDIKGGADIKCTRYNLTGQAIAICQVIDNPAAGITTHMAAVSLNNYTNGRLISVVKKVYKIHTDASPAETRTLLTNTYDAMGQLKKKALGQKKDDAGVLTTAALENLTYGYNIRGWLAGINTNYIKTSGTESVLTDSWFGMSLSYDWGFGANQFNGNIGGTKWRSRGDGERRSYGYGYDLENRLLYGDFAQYSGTAYADHAAVNYDMNMGIYSGSTYTARSAYDENGNIMAMKQSGLTFGANGAQATVLDDLKYNYTTNTNQLKNVIDVQNVTATTNGDFRSSQAYMTALASNKTAAAIDYTYDINGNLQKDLNKDIGPNAANGIEYNHLNLPWRITVQNKGTIVYLYDATGNKLSKTVNETGKTEKVTDYITNTVYREDVLQFIGHEEGRMRIAAQTATGCTGTGIQWLAFDYFIKDHLGNVRMTLTDELQKDMYPAATMETQNAGIENTYYSKIEQTRTDVSTIAGYPVIANNNSVAKLSSLGQKVGPGIMLKVMAGDRVDIKCDTWYKYVAGQSVTNTNPLSDILLQIAAAISGASGGKISAAQTGTNGSVFTTPVNSLLASQTPPATDKPKAYINWLLLDDQMNTAAGSSAVPVQPGTSTAPYTLVMACTGAVQVQENGYIYVYTSNESNIPVYFDNLQVNQIHGPLLEETHYYPFGLAMAGISSKAAGTLVNKEQTFQEQRFDDDLGLNWILFKWRTHDPQIARFLQIDPLADGYRYNSTYAFSENRVTDGRELEGLEYVSIHHYSDGETFTRMHYKSTDKEINDINGTTAGIYNSASYGAEGKGVVHYSYNSNGEIFETRWEQRQTGANSNFEFHGLYSGPGCITKDGKGANYDFRFQPIDWPDAIAKRHDMDYVAATAAGEKYAGFLEDVRTVQADRDMVQRLKDYANPFKKVEGVETPYRTSWSGEMHLSIDGQLTAINALATYKQWKIDNGYGNKDSFETLRKHFYKYDAVTAAIIDLIRPNKQ
jgi:RHS repeat-associated protein